MTVPPERLAESERATLLFHVALVQLGAETVQDSLSLWGDVPAVPGTASSAATAKWLSLAVAYTLRRRLKARDLALAYYRYERALVTGRTIALPGQVKPPYVTLPELKREFEAQINPEPIQPKPEQPQVKHEVPDWAKAQPTSPANTDPTPDLPAPEEVDPLDQILLDEIDGLEQEIADAEKRAEEEIKSILENLGPNNLERKLKLLNSQTIEEADRDRQQAHKEAGRRQAATAAREAMNGARGTSFDTGAKDPKVIGFVRLSRTGTPCGWCAMLISRGPVLKNDKITNLYRSSQGTGVKDGGEIVTFGDLDLYHDNCQCYAVPIFSLEQYNSDPLFALNREYADLWPKVTKGLGGKSAVSAWRRFIRQQASSHKSQAAAA